MIVPIFIAISSASSSSVSISAASKRKSSQLLSIDIVPIVLCEAVDKERSRLSSEQHDTAKSARLALSLTSETLLDHTAAEIGVDEAGLRPSNGIAESGSRNTFLCREPGEGLGLEEAHSTTRDQLQVL